MSYRSIDSTDGLQDALDRSQSEPIVLFKHSNTCDLSAMARREMVTIDIPVFELVVQTARPLSNHIEAHFGIRHESPQVILLHEGEAIFNASHRAVTADNIYSAVSPLLAS
ncbi:MAG: bacillithiol system redox-active protein YtxJ [Rhodothermaceae bacterium]|nr:bacillithiol system redox-active protein YtxJ [Rhodothermaceae bacterium]